MMVFTPFVLSSISRYVPDIGAPVELLPVLNPTPRTPGTRS